MALHRRPTNSTFIMAKMTMADGKNTVKTLRYVHLLRRAVSPPLAGLWVQP
jgi:hypothetical protein